MRMQAYFDPDPVQLFREMDLESRRAVTEGMRIAGEGLKRDWQTQIQGAGLGRGLSKAIKTRLFPRNLDSSSAASWTYVEPKNAPRVIEAFEQGAVIRARGSTFLAIPLPTAGARVGRSRTTGRFQSLTPSLWQQRTGITLRMVPRTRNHALLVADEARLSTRGNAVMNRRRVRKDGTRTGSMTIPIFVLVPQVRLRKRLDLAGPANAWAGRLPGLITGNWPAGGVS